MIPGDTVTVGNDESKQVNSAGLGIQLLLLWHVTLRVVSLVELRWNSFSQVSSKMEPSRVEV